MRRGRFFAGVVVLGAIGALAISCKKSPPSTVLQPEDLADNGVPFDPTEIIDPGSFTDNATFGAIDMQGFLEHTPYNRASFLSTYQSNGVRAVDAVMSASQKYGINPLVFFARAEVDQGLIGAEYYPFPPSRVEYVFGCGCAAANVCDPALAGFDRQVDCLARELSTSLSQIAANGATAGGWGPGRPAVTIDGQNVTPQDASTAALYQHDPFVGTGQRGNWLMWNIWQLDITFLAYSGPVGGGATQGGWIGDACTADANCAVPGGFCATNFPGGMCTIPCGDAGACPTGDNKPASFCADFGGGKGGYCLSVCNPGVTGSCREGYDCNAILVLGSATDSQNGCTQKTQ